MERRLIVAAMCYALAGAAVASAPVQAAAPANTAPQIENLKQTLEQVLRARRPEEFQFITHVVELVDAGTLPRPMVESTLLWVRKKKPKRPFQYFEQALKLRAKEIGVEL